MYSDLTNMVWVTALIHGWVYLVLALGIGDPDWQMAPVKGVVAGTSIALIGWLIIKGFEARQPLEFEKY